MIDEFSVENGRRFVCVDQGSAKRRPWNADFERLVGEGYDGGGRRSVNGRHGTAEQATTAAADAGLGDDADAGAFAWWRRRRINDPEAGRRPKGQRPPPRLTIMDAESAAKVAGKCDVIGAGEAGAIHHGKPELEGGATVPDQGEGALGLFETVIEERLLRRSGD